MNIKHAPQFDTALVEAHYSERDGVPISYVCSTDLNNSDVPFDIFFRETPHPEFGNRYFGLRRTEVGAQALIVGADQVEDYDIGMIESSDGEWWYSQSHHDCIMIDGKMIDGGRQYTRGNGFELFHIRNGKIFKHEAQPINHDYPDFVENMDFS